MRGLCVFGTTQGFHLSGFGALRDPGVRTLAALDIHLVDGPADAGMTWILLPGSLGASPAMLVARCDHARDHRNRDGFWGVAAVFSGREFDEDRSRALRFVDRLFATAMGAGAVRHGATLKLEIAVDALSHIDVEPSSGAQFDTAHRGELFVMEPAFDWRSEQVSHDELVGFTLENEGAIAPSRGFILTDVARRKSKYRADASGEIAMPDIEAYRGFMKQKSALEKEVFDLKETLRRLESRDPSAFGTPRPSESSVPPYNAGQSADETASVLPVRNVRRKEAEDALLSPEQSVTLEPIQGPSGRTGEKKSRPPRGVQPHLDMRGASPRRDDIEEDQWSLGGFDARWLVVIAMIPIAVMVAIIASDLIRNPPAIFGGDQSGLSREVDNSDSDELSTMTDPADILRNPSAAAVRRYRELDDERFAAAREADSPAAYEAYISSFDRPQRPGRHLDEARTALDGAARRSRSGEIQTKLFAIGLVPQAEGSSLSEMQGAWRELSLRDCSDLAPIQLASASVVELESAERCLETIVQQLASSDPVRRLSDTFTDAGLLGGGSQDLIAVQRAARELNDQPLDMRNQRKLRLAEAAAVQETRSNTIRQLQTELFEMGYYRGEPDGGGGRKTKEAWDRFVLRNRGRVDPNVSTFDPTKLERLKEQAILLASLRGDPDLNRAR